MMTVTSSPEFEASNPLKNSDVLCYLAIVRKSKPFKNWAAVPSSSLSEVIAQWPFVHFSHVFERAHIAKVVNPLAKGHRTPDADIR